MPERLSSAGKEIGERFQTKNHQLQITNYFVLLTAMELRKDPITRSWGITGDDVGEPAPRSQACRFCGPSADLTNVIATLPGVDSSASSAPSVLHPQALHRIEGDAARRGDGLYER